LEAYVHLAMFPESNFEENTTFPNLNSVC